MVRQPLAAVEEQHCQTPVDLGQLHQPHSLVVVALTA